MRRDGATDRLANDHRLPARHWRAFLFQVSFMTQILSIERQANSVLPGADASAEQAIGQLLEGRDLDRGASMQLFTEIVEGRLSEPLLAAAFVALRVKGETSAELIGAAKALRAAAVPFPSPENLFADSCGTGGDFS